MYTSQNGGVPYHHNNHEINFFFQILYTGVEILLRFNIFLRYGCICHILGPKPLAHGCMNFTIFIEGFMDIITVHLVFFLSVKVEKIFETCFFFQSWPWGPGVVKLWIIQLRLSYRCFKSVGFLVFKKKIKL